jgi:DNA-binding transcriptional LysR family regulator
VLLSLLGLLLRQPEQHFDRPKRCLIESRLGARLIIRTPRRFALTDAGRQLVDRAAHILAEGEAAEDVTQAQARTPRGLVRLAAPMSFGTLQVAPLLPGFLAAFPDISIDPHLSDAMTDLIGEGFDAAICIAFQPGTSLVVQRLCQVPRYLVGSPRYTSPRSSTPEQIAFKQAHRFW